VDADIVEVKLHPVHGAGSWASNGYIKKENNDKAGRHYIMIQLEKEEPDTYHNALVAHEMGHILGMVHEHQRLDRNWWIHWDCTKVYGYAAANARYAREAQEDWPSMEAICNSNWMGSRYLHWPAPAEYTQDMGKTGDKTNIPSNPVKYDKESIMGYGSSTWSDKEDPGVTEAPIVYWKVPGSHRLKEKPNENNAVLIPNIYAVSDGDVEFVKSFYPWGKTSEVFKA